MYVPLPKSFDLNQTDITITKEKRNLIYEEKSSEDLNIF